MRFSAAKHHFRLVQLQLRSLPLSPSRPGLVFDSPPPTIVLSDPADSGANLLHSPSLALYPTVRLPSTSTMSAQNPTGFDIKEFKAAASPKSVYAKRDPWAR